MYVNKEYEKYVIDRLNDNDIKPIQNTITHKTVIGKHREKGCKKIFCEKISIIDCGNAVESYKITIDYFNSTLRLFEKPRIFVSAEWECGEKLQNFNQNNVNGEIHKTVNKKPAVLKTVNKKPVVWIVQDNDNLRECYGDMTELNKQIDLKLFKNLKDCLEEISKPEAIIIDVGELSPRKVVPREKEDYDFRILKIIFEKNQSADFGFYSGIIQFVEKDLKELIQSELDGRKCSFFDNGRDDINRFLDDLMLSKNLYYYEGVEITKKVIRGCCV